jgi:hypothetical protein
MPWLRWHFAGACVISGGSLGPPPHAMRPARVAERLLSLPRRFIRRGAIPKKSAEWSAPHPE